MDALLLVTAGTSFKYQFKVAWSHIFCKHAVHKFDATSTGACQRKSTKSTAAKYECHRCTLNIKEMTISYYKDDDDEGFSVNCFTDGKKLITFKLPNSMLSDVNVHDFHNVAFE